MPANYPVSLASFFKYVDQPWVAGDTITGPAGTPIDLTIDDAAITRQIQEEVVAIEQTIGLNPRIPPKAMPLGGTIQWLYNNLAWGKVDTHNVVPPTPPPSHNHYHKEGRNLTSDDHPQYMTVNGDVGRPHGFTNPVTGHAATSSNHLITLSQARGAGLTAAQVKAIVDAELNEATADPNFPGSKPMTGPGPGHWRLAGGYFYGPSDENGVIRIDYSRCHFSQLASFNYMKRPFPGWSMLGWYNYQYMEDQLLLVGLDARGASIQFIEDIVVDRQAAVSLTWMALGY